MHATKCARESTPLHAPTPRTDGVVRTVQLTAFTTYRNTADTAFYVTFCAIEARSRAPLSPASTASPPLTRVRFTRGHCCCFHSLVGGAVVEVVSEAEAVEGVGEGCLTALGVLHASLCPQTWGTSLRRCSRMMPSSSAAKARGTPTGQAPTSASPSCPVCCRCWARRRRVPGYGCRFRSGRSDQRHAH